MIVAAMPYRERKEWTHEMLSAVGLWERRHHNLQQLSGGEQQRTAIGVSLANKPVMLLADEPTGEVDSATAQVIMDTLRHLNEEYNLTVVMVTHDIRVENQVDRVVTIRDGRTSSERVRRLRAAQIEESGEDEGDGESAEHTYHEYVVLDYAGRLQIPREFLEEMGISDRAQVELTADGILVKPAIGLDDTTAQAARISEVAETWGPQARSKDWKLRLGDAGRGIRGLLRKDKN